MIRSVQEGAVRRITLVDGTFSRDLLTVIANAEADPTIGAILIDAEGSRFCGAIDFADPPPNEFFAERFAKPIIASMQGVALSAGLVILANAHIVLAAQGSSFGLTDLREGRCDPRVNTAVARVLGERRTRELAITGRIFTTPDALNWGLVHAATPAFELDDRATAVAQGIARGNRAAIKLVLEWSHPSS